MASFTTMLPMVLTWEGTKYTDDPRDNGGATKYGITQGALSEFLGRQATKDEVKKLTVEKAGEIYKKKYWDKIQGDKLGEGVALIMFDGSVNHGTRPMIEYLQRAVGVTVDGNFGDKTLEAANNFANQFNLVLALSGARKARYENHEDFDRFGTGWMNRLKDITNKALAFENKYVVKKPEVNIVEEPVVEEPVVEVPVVPEPLPAQIKLDKLSDVLSNETIQKLLQVDGLYNGKIDGVIGSNSMSAIEAILSKIDTKNWTKERKIIAVGQYYALKYGIDSGKVDGLKGPQTQNAFKEFNNLIETGKEFPKWRDEPVVVSPPVIITPVSNNWPSQAGVEKFYGKVGENQTSLILPYKMKIAWDLDTSVSKFSCHEKVHDSLLRIFNNVLSEYGESKISELKLDVFGGCLNVRKMRGGSAWSMHAWGIAVDLDPERNQLSWDKSKAAFAKPEYEAFWKIVEAEGWLSLGRKKNYDWMHFQAATI